MKVAVAADHAGSLLLRPVLDELRRLGHEALDLGTHDAVTPDDYPDRAADIAAALTAGPGRARSSHLRQRRGRFGGSQQGTRHSRRALPRHLFGAPGRGARPDERALPGVSSDRTKPGVGAGAGLSGRHHQRRTHGICGGWKRLPPWNPVLTTSKRSNEEMSDGQQSFSPVEQVGTEPVVRPDDAVAGLPGHAEKNDRRGWAAGT